MKKFNSRIILKKLSSLKILILLLLLLTQNISYSRYYKKLDTILVRFTMDENLKLGVDENYENKEL